METYEYDLCPDCAIYAANNDESGASDNWAARAYRGYIAGFIVGDRVDEFSATKCDGCDDHEYGTRHGATRHDELDAPWH